MSTPRRGILKGGGRSCAPRITSAPDGSGCSEGLPGSTAMAINQSSSFFYAEMARGSLLPRLSRARRATKCSPRASQLAIFPPIRTRTSTRQRQLVSRVDRSDFSSPAIPSESVLNLYFLESVLKHWKTLKTFDFQSPFTRILHSKFDLFI